MPALLFYFEPRVLEVYEGKQHMCKGSVTVHIGKGHGNTLDIPTFLYRYLSETALLALQTGREQEKAEGTMQIELNNAMPFEYIGRRIDLRPRKSLSHT